MNLADESELPSQGVKQFLPGHQRNIRSCVILVEDYPHFLLTLERCFQLVQPGAVLVGIKSFSFPEGTHYRGLSFNPTTYTTSPALDEDRLLGWLMGGSFHLSQDLFHSTLLYSIHFHHPSQFVLKVNNFVMFKYRESHAEIRSRRFFFYT